MTSLPRPRSAPACASVAAILALIPAAALRADEPVVWTNTVGVSTAGDALTKTGGNSAWDAGAASVSVIRDGNGYVEWTVSDVSPQTMVGLSHGDSGTNYDDIDYALHTSGGGLYVFQAGTNVGYFGPVSGGVRLRIEVRYGVVRYLRNGTVVYTSAVPPRYPLRVDAELYQPGHSIQGVRVGNVVWANETGVSISGTSLTKVGAAGWTSGAVSANAIEAADGFVEFTATETNTTRAAGLSNGDSSQDVADIDFAIKVRDDATIEVTEAGTSKGTFGSYVAGDRFRVELSGGTVRYARNGSVFYTSTATPTYPLRADTALYSAAATLTDVSLESILWTSVTGVSANTATLTKTAADGWNADASSTQTIASGDGYVEFIALESNTRRALGLDGGSGAQSYADLDFAIDLDASGGLTVYESGTSRGQFGTYTHGDRLRVEIQDGIVRYKKNGTVLYTSSTAPQYPVHAEAALYTSGATVAEVVVGDVVLANDVGVSIFGSGFTRGNAAADWTAGAISTRAINEGYVEFIASEATLDRMVGLSHGDSNQSYTDIDFAAYLTYIGSVQVYEAGVYRGSFGSYVAGDRLRVALESGVVKYYKNGTLFYTSTTVPVLPLRVDTSANEPNATVLGIVLTGTAVTDTVETPTLSPTGGTYNAAQSVTISAPGGSTIRYTLDGTDPTTSSTVYSAPVTVSQSATLKAKAWKTAYDPSATAAATYTLKVATTMAPGAGTYANAQLVTVTASATGADIHYTTNGADPTQGDPVVASGGTISVGMPMTVKVRAWNSGWDPSDIAAATYGFQVATPTLVPAGGPYVGALPVTVSTATSDATLRYRLDGGIPTETDPIVASGASVAVAHSATLKVVGFRSGWSNSAVASGTYWISLGSVATPTLSPAPGTFTSAQSVTIGTATSGATIRYTTDGTEPGYQSPVYSSAVAVGRTTVLKARAFAADMTASGTAGGLYRIDVGTVDPPRFSPGGGVYAAKQSVTITSETAGAVIHYRTDGVIADENDPVVSSGSAVTIDQNAHLTARAFKASTTPSAGVWADYRITGGAAVGGNHTVALRADGTVWTWGHNQFSALGDPALGNGAVRTEPAQVAGISNAVAVASAGSHTLALKADGTVYGWGRNLMGELGDGTASQSSTPVQASGLTDVVAIAAGEFVSLALKRDGSVWEWGSDNVVNYGAVPVQVSGLRGVSAIAMGTDFALAVQSDGAVGGTLWTWGDNVAGQLGDGTTTSRGSPVAIAQAVKSAAGGNFHAYAVKTDGTALAWGLNNYYQLGNGTQAPSYRPVLIPGLSGIAGMTVGSSSGSAVRTDGSVAGWASNAYGQVGDKTGTDRTTPVEAFVRSALSVAGHGSSYHRAAVIGDGTLWTWGFNEVGPLGDGTTSTNATPKPVPNFTLTSNAQWSLDNDGDGLSNAEELALGTDGRQADTNGDGVTDGAAQKAGLSATNTDMDGDGVSNADEAARGTDPFRTDTDEDGHADGADCFPLDAARWQCPAADPNDHTPPVITLQEPTNASLVSSVPPQ